MAEWIEIPAHRILMVSWAEFHEEGAFTRLDAHGNKALPGEDPYMIMRKDGKKFKPARFFPLCPSIDEWRQGNTMGAVYLEEF